MCGIEMISGEIEEINRLVRKYIDVYEFRISPDHLEFAFVVGDNKRFEDNFEKLRIELKKRGLVPVIRKNGGEYVLLIARMQHRHFFGIWVNVIMLILTVLSTIWVGMGYYVAYYGSSGLWGDILGGFLYFSLPLLTILGCHEMGHYFAAKKHNIAASLPFFIPAPTMLGTLGAFISIREPIPDKKALIDVGLSGPIVGFLVAIPVTIIGLILGSTTPPHVDMESMNTYMVFNVPLIYQFLEYLFPSSSFVNPVAMAGWVGFVVTAINLFPVGQLDGGHAARAVLGDKVKYVSYGFAGLLILLGLIYPGWLIFGILVFFLGLNHPPPLNDLTKLDKKRYAIALAGLIIFAVTFVPVPVEMHHVHESITMEVDYGSGILISNTSASTTWVSLNITNKGEMRENITVLTSGNFKIKGALNHTLTFSLDREHWRVFAVNITPNSVGNNTLSFNLRTKTGISLWKNVTFTCLKTTGTLYFKPNHVHGSDFNVTIYNNGPNRTLHFISIGNVLFNVTNINGTTLKMNANSSEMLHILVLGNTEILAIDYRTYEVAILRVNI